MAIQNFLGGGYYGKLGATVGQRWKNIRTIRSYVIPHDPKTPAQLVQRNQFASAVVFSQVANQANYTVTAFDTVNNTKWAGRMSCARSNIANGKEGLNLIPLYPYNFSCPYSITSCNFSSLDAQGNLHLVVAGTLPVTARYISVLVRENSETFDPEQVGIVPAYFDPSETAQVTISAPYGAELQVGDLIRFASIDDEDSDTDAFSSNEIELQSQAKPISSFLTTIRSTSLLADGVLVVFSQPYETFEGTYLNADLSYVAHGDECTYNFTNEPLVNTDGYCSVKATIPYDTPFNKAFLPSGSKLSITSIYAESETDIYTSTSVIETCENATVSTTCYYLFADNPVSGNMVSLQSNLVVDNAFTQSVACSITFNPTISDATEDTVTKTGTINFGTTNTTLQFANASGFNYPSWNGASITIPSCSITKNGVIYNFALQTLEYSNLNTQFDTLEVEDVYTMGEQISSGVYSYRPFMKIGCTEGGSITASVPTESYTVAVMLNLVSGTYLSWGVTHSASYTHNSNDGYVYIPLTNERKGSYSTRPNMDTIEQGVEEDWEDRVFTVTLTRNGVTSTQEIQALWIETQDANYFSE